MPNLIIHLGTQKTGTSVLQEFISQYRDQLLKQKVNYLLWGRGPKGKAAQHAHHVLAHHWAPGWLTPQLLKGQAERAWTEFCETVLRKEDQTFVISSEHFYKATVLNPGIAEGIRDSLPGVSVSVVCYFRRPDTFALSNWAHSIKTVRNFRMTFADYSQSAPLAALLSYRQNIALWQDAFGRNNVITRIYDRNYFQNGDIIDDFLGIVGVKREKNMLDIGNINVSLSPFTLDFLHNLDRTSISRYSQLVEALEGYAVAHVSNERSRELSPLSNDLANDLLDRFGEDYRQMSLDTVEGGLNIDDIRPKDKGHVYKPVSQELLDLSMALWHPAKTKASLTVKKRS